MSLGSIAFMNQKKKKLKKLRLILICTIALGFTRASAVDAFVEVLSFSQDSSIAWSISNELNHVAYTSDDFSSDTAQMILDADARYYFNLFADSALTQDGDLLMLQVDGASIILVKADIGNGEFSYPFFTGQKEPVLKIVGGSNASITDIPWQVYFSSGNYMCGGSIISKQWILTAAHCTQDGDGVAIKVQDMSVKVGTSTPYGSSGKWYSVKSYTIHESYNSDGLTDDIAVLELYDEIDFANAEIIELVSSEDVAAGATDPGVMSLVSGWGLTAVSPDKFPDQLQKVELPIVSNATAASVWGYTPETMLMAGYKNGNKDACSGDSGGPLVVTYNEENKLAGIVSWGSEECNTYGAFTRVSSYLGWIFEQTGVSPEASLIKPIGDTEVCQGTERSDYSTSDATSGTYEWILSPDTAGVLTFEDQSASVTWDDAFLGTCEIQVRGEIEGELTDWAIQNVELQENTIVHSFSDDLIVCEGDMFSFHVVAEGHNLSYTWYKDSAFYGSSPYGLLSFPYADTLYSGSYYCVVNGSCGEVATDKFDLIVYPNTTVAYISDDQRAEHDDKVIIKVSAVGHDKQYQWYKDGEIMMGANEQILTLEAVDANDIGRYNVEVDGTCQSDTSSVVYVYVGKKSDDVQARIWPSVVSNELNTAISNNEEYLVEIYDTSGRLIYQEDAVVNQHVINATSWISGVYVLRISLGDIAETFKFIKE